MNHVQQHLEEIKKSISNSFAGERLTIEELEKSASDYFEKAKAITPLGTIKEFGGRPYIKTNDGWKYHGKGTGAKAQEHAKSAGVVSKYTKDDHTRLNELLNKRQAGILKHGSKEWNEYKALQAKYAEHLGAKQDKAKEKAAEAPKKESKDLTYEEHEKLYFQHKQKAEELLNHPSFPSKYDRPKKGTKEWEMGRQMEEYSDKAQHHFSEMLKIKNSQKASEKTDKVNVSQAIDDTFKQFEKQNSGPYLLNKVDKKVEKILKDSGLTVSKEALQTITQGVLNKVHGKYETRPNMTHTIYREPSFFEKQQLQQYAMHAGDEARHSLAKREMLAAEANKRLNAIRVELEEDGYDVDKLGNKLYMNNYDYSKVGNLSDYKKKK